MVPSVLHVDSEETMTSMISSTSDRDEISCFSVKFPSDYVNLLYNRNYYTEFK